MEMDIDVRCLPYMPLQIEQLRKSKTWLRCRRQPELGFYLMNLWMRAWHEVPAGSIEDDDDILADAAMCSPEAWERLRPILLHGWEALDGRLYHKTVTELATEGFGKLRKNKQRTEAARRAAEEKRVSALADDAENPVTEPVTEDVTDTVTGPEGKGREGKRNIEPIGSLSGSGPDDRPKAKSAVSYSQAFESFWSIYPRTPNMSKKEASDAWRKLDNADRAACVAAVPGYVAFLKGKPDLETIHACRFISKRRFEGYGRGAAATVTEETWVKRLRHGRTRATWSTSQWGPMPGQAGSQVPSSLLQAGDGDGWQEWEQAA